MNRILLIAALATLTLANCNRNPSRVLHNMGGKQATTPGSTTILSTSGNNNARLTGPRRTEILFLGDKGHHKPIERVPELMAALGNKGINITYTDRLEDLNTANLNRFDGLLIYANWDSIPKPQERALLDYVSSGHG